MNELILLKSGEIALKGLNRGSFEDRLIKNAKRALKHLGGFRFFKAQSAIYAEPLEDCDLDEAVERLSRVFGFAGLARAGVADKEYDAIRQRAIEYLGSQLAEAETFKVTAKRADKSFPMTSPEICRELGHDLSGQFPHLRVDVNNPDVDVVVEVRDFAAYVHTRQQPGAGGIPVGSGGRAALLLSGGIDSPVAGWMMAKRGLELIGIYFESPPYTSARALLKVETLCEKMAVWTGRIPLFVVPFTKIQEIIKENCPEALFTLVMRRFMMRVAEELALSQNCGALITGESVSQVASQTMGALACTNAAVKTIPVFRPVIGMDKEEIITISRKIDTFETSILPYEDCCTVFTPKHPKTNPRLDDLLRAEAELPVEELIQKVVEETTWKLFG